MPSFLSSYLSSPKRSTIKPAGGQFPVVRRYNPYTSQNSRASSPTASASPFSGQDLASALLQQQQNRKATTPSSNFVDSYNYDPIQAKIQALGTQSVANARTNAAQVRNEAAITEGDPELLRSLGFDENTIAAAKNNPESLLSTLNNDYAQRQRDLADSMQAQNLYYSGEYQRNLSDLAKGKASAEGGLGSKLRELLSGADTGVLDAQELDRKQQEQAAIDAASQAQYQNLYDALLGLNANPPPPPPPTGGLGSPVPISSPGDLTGTPGDVYAPTDTLGNQTAPNLVDPGFTMTSQPPIDLGNGLVYDPATHTIHQKPRLY